MLMKQIHWGIQECSKQGSAFDEYMNPKVWELKKYFIWMNCDAMRQLQTRTDATMSIMREVIGKACKLLIIQFSCVTFAVFIPRLIFDESLMHECFAPWNRIDFPERAKKNIHELHRNSFLTDYFDRNSFNCISQTTQNTAIYENFDGETSISHCMLAAVTLVLCRERNSDSASKTSNSLCQTHELSAEH